MELVKCCEFVYEISVSLAWLTHINLKNPAFPNNPQKRPNRGWYVSRGVFPYSGGESLTQAHTGGHRGYFSSLTAKEKDMHALTNTTTTPYSMRVCNSV